MEAISGKVPAQSEQIQWIGGAKVVTRRIETLHVEQLDCWSPSIFSLILVHILKQWGCGVMGAKE